MPPQREVHHVEIGRVEAGNQLLAIGTVEHGVGVVIIPVVLSIKKRRTHIGPPL